MALLESIGRTNALSRATGNLRDEMQRRRNESRQSEIDEVDLGFKQASEDRAERALSLQEETGGVDLTIKKAQLAEARAERQYGEVVEPLSAIRSKLPGVTDTAWAKMIEVAENAGRIVRVEGSPESEPGMSRDGQSDTLADISSSMKMQKILDIATLGDLNQSKIEVIQAGQNPKLKPEDRQLLEQQLSQINMGISAIMTKQKPLDLAVQQELAREQLISKDEVDPQKRLSKLNSTIASLEKARFNAMNKGTAANDMVAFAASLTGQDVPDVTKPEGLDRYIAMLDEQLDDLGEEVSDLTGEDFQSNQRPTQVSEQETRPITPEEAAAIMEEVGSDPRKAEQLATERGLSF